MKQKHQQKVKGGASKSVLRLPDLEIAKSVQTTERYLGCTQLISCAVNDRIGIEPKP